MPGCVGCCASYFGSRRFPAARSRSASSTFGTTGADPSCDAPWGSFLLEHEGRICLQGVNAAAWGGFDHEQADICEITGGDLMGGEPCTPDKRFALFVRRPTCGNNIVEVGENCDDGNTGSDDGCTSLCQEYDTTVTNCHEVLEQLEVAESDLYLVDLDGDGPGAPQKVWCDMETDGGGWTLCSEGHKNAETQLAWREPGSEDNWYACHHLTQQPGQLKVRGYNTEYDHSWLFSDVNPSEDNDPPATNMQLLTSVMSHFKDAPKDPPQIGAPMRLADMSSTAHMF